MTGSTQLMLTSLAAGVATGGITALMGGSLEESLMNGAFGSLACYGMGLAWGATTFTFGASAAAEITTAAATGYTNQIYSWGNKYIMHIKSSMLYLDSKLKNLEMFPAFARISLILLPILYMN